MKTIVKCSNCSEVTLAEGDHDITIEIDFRRYVISYMCPVCRKLNEMHVEPSKHDLAKRQPLPGIRVF